MGQSAPEPVDTPTPEKEQPQEEQATPEVLTEETTETQQADTDGEAQPA